MTAKNEPTETQSLAKIDQFQALSPASSGNIAEALKENLGTLSKADEFMLDHVKVPTGGGTTWEIPSVDGTEDTKEIEGVIVAWKEPRAFWAQSFDKSGGGTPPDCYSDDGVRGEGTPGGLCFECPKSKFGSDDKGRGQACKAMKLLFVLRKDDFLPIVVVAPPSSLRTLQKYFLRLASKGIKYCGVLTKLTLDKTANQDGIAYSRIAPAMSELLNEGDLKRVKEYAKGIEPFVKRSSQDMTAEA